MVRQILFVVMAGFLVLFGGTTAIGTAQNQTPTTNATMSVVQVTDGVTQGLNGLLFGLMFLVLLSAVLMLRG